MLMDRNYLAFALLLALLSTSCSVISLCESYRALLTAQPMLMQGERSVDLWAVSAFTSYRSQPRPLRLAGHNCHRLATEINSSYKKKDLI